MDIFWLWEAYRLSLPFMFIFDWTFALQGVLLTTISILGVVGNSMTVYVLVKVTDLHREGYQNIHQLRMSPQTEEKQVTLDVTNSLGLQ